MSTPHRPRRSLLLATAGVVAVVAALGAFLPAYLAYATDEGARQLLGSRDGGDVALDIALPLDAVDPAQQDAAVRGAIEAEFGPGGAGLAISVHRTVAAGTISTPIGAVIVTSIPHLDDEAVLDAGAWPRTAGDAAIEADSAGARATDAGETLEVGGVALTVAGTWRLLDDRDGRWFALPQPPSPVDGESRTRIVVDEATLEKVARGAGVEVTAHWTVVPNVATATASGLDGAVAAWRAVPAALRSAGVDVDELETSGRLLPTVLVARAQAAAMATAPPLALSTFGIVALVALVEIARLLGATRTSELTLLWSRGASRRRLITDAAREVAPATVLGALGGAVAAAVALAAVGGVSMLRDGAPSLVTASLVAAVAAAAIIVARTANDARALDAPVRRRDPRLAATGRAVLVVVAVLAAAVSGWQLMLYGSARSDAGIRASADPLAVVAPALCLIGIVLLLESALLLARRPLERWAARTTRATRSLVVRGLVRRRGFALTPILLCALAIGQLVIAAGYTGTWQAASAAASARHEGTAVGVTGPVGSLTSDVMARVSAIPGVGAVAPVSVQSISVAAESTALVTMSAPALAELGDPAIPDLADAVAAMTPAQTGGFVAPGDSVGVSLDWAGGPAEATVSGVFADEWGNIASSAFEAIRFDDGAGTVRVEVPGSDGAATGTWRLAGVDVVAAAPPASGSTIEVTGLEVDGADVAPGRWDGGDLGDYPLPLERPETGNALLVPPGIDGVRLVAVPVPAPPPVVVSALFAERTGVEVGDLVPLVLDSFTGPTSVRVAAVVQAVPGAGTPVALLVDLRSVLPVHLIHQRQTPAPDRAWLEVTGQTDEVIAAVREALPTAYTVDGTAVSHADTAATASAIALWIGAIGTSLLALGAVAGVAGAQAWSRRDESDALRMIGLTARRQSGARVSELAIACGTGSLIGVAAGASIALLLVPAVARGAVAGTDLGSIAPATDPLWLAVSVGGFLLALAAALLLTAPRPQGSAGRTGER
ncbi:hypothetical protein [Microbacterium terricola]|uniref:hypothetical protein n=1 Tax=Microbacterium terricola TaxID=344163 RepID=UPI0021E87AF3|nr:hypothetical protein [Microbacterium terricola]UYK39316.1 hypothetical protein OAU46_11480 [Microbacterium terricola]